MSRRAGRPRGGGRSGACDGVIEREWYQRTLARHRSPYAPGTGPRRRGTIAAEDLDEPARKARLPDLIALAAAGVPLFERRPRACELQAAALAECGES